MIVDQAVAWDAILENKFVLIRANLNSNSNGNAEQCFGYFPEETGQKAGDESTNGLEYIIS